MADEIAAVCLTRTTWTAIFIAQIGYLYTILASREELMPESHEWRQLDGSIREAVKTFMPVLEKAALLSPELGKIWFDFKRATCFPTELHEDTINEVVVFL